MGQNLTTAVIRGKTYNKWDAFWCQETLIGNSNSMGTGYEIATLKIGDHCRFLYYNDEGVPYPYCIAKFDDTPGEDDVLGWFTEDVFPDYTKPKYAISYEGNADDVTGVPASQNKIHDEDLILSSDIPVRNGYEFQGWRAVYASDSLKKEDYLPGGTYSVNDGARMWAKWGAIVTYYPNGDSVTNMPEPQTKTFQSNLILTNVVPERTDYRFRGWATSQEDAEAGNVTYTNGATYAEEKTLNLYAVWMPNYDDPTVTNVTVVRCDVDGNEDTMGKYAKVEYAYTVDDELEISSVVIMYGNVSEIVDVSENPYIIGGELNPFKDITVTVKVTDNVGLTTESSYTLVAVPYNAPTITNVVAMRTNSEYVEDNEGMYAKITFVFDYDDMDGENSIVSITSAYRELNSVTDFINQATVQYNDNEGTVTVENATLDTEKQYEFVITVADKVSSVSKYALIPRSFFTLKFKDGGKGIAIGKNSTEDGFEVDMESRFLRDVYIGGCKYGSNQILWNNVNLMDGNAVINLNGKVSEQPNGIVLVFSGYEDGVAKDVSINTFFVSKKDIELFTYNETSLTGGHTFLLGVNAGFSEMAAKYLYFTDTSIRGHETNILSGNNSGITFDNSKYVLRYVIGV